MQNTQRSWVSIDKGQIAVESWMLNQHTNSSTPTPHLIIDLGKSVGLLWPNGTNREVWRQGWTINGGHTIQELMERALIETVLTKRREDIWFNPIGWNGIRAEIENRGEWPITMLYGRYAVRSLSQGQ